MLLQTFKETFIDDWNDCNVFRLADNILIKYNDNYYIYNVTTKQWNTENYIQLNNNDLLKFCEPKQYVFRGTYLGEYLNTFLIKTLYYKDLRFLFPEYEFIVEQAIKLQIPFILNSFRNDNLNFIKNMNCTSLVKATELNSKQLNIFQEYIQTTKNDAMYYFLRLNNLVPSFKGLNEEIFNKLCSIALNDNITNTDIELYQDLILSKPGNLIQKLDKIQDYIKYNFHEYRINWKVLQELDKLDITEYPELPRASKLEELIPSIQQKVNEYEDEARYAVLNEKFKQFIKTIKNFEFNTDKYCIIAPELVQELDLEGNILHHCVGSFKDNLASGKEIILFLRHKDNPKIPFYTINLDNDGYIRQIHTKYNGDIKDDPEKEDLQQFLKLWADNKSDIINKKSIKSHYGALCHQ